MNIVSKQKHKIFVNDYEGKELYSIGLSKKDIAGNYINGYMPCRFKKDEHVPNKSNIIIKDAWLDFNVSNKKTYPYIFINEYEIVNDNQETKKDVYEEMGKEIEIDETELPF
jgi:hypothetical protein